MSSLNVSTKTVIFKTNGNPDEIASALVKLGDIDCDFSGDNGDEYLWPISRRKGFETNAEYVANKVVTSKTVMGQVAKKGIKAYTEAFVKEWLKHEGFYDSMEIDVAKLDGLAEDPNITGVYAFTIVATDSD